MCAQQLYIVDMIISGLHSRKKNHFNGFVCPFVME